MTKHGKTAFETKLGIGRVRYDPSTETVKITLARPQKGEVQVTIQSGRMGANGALSRSAFSIVVT